MDEAETKNMKGRKNGAENEKWKKKCKRGEQRGRE